MPLKPFMKNKIPTITIAICALNEEGNIGSLLESIFQQKEKGYKLEKILIVSDGSTDNTVTIAKTFPSKKIEIKDYKKRLGKSLRLNEIYSRVTSDIVVQPDADVVLADPYTISEIVAAFEENDRIGMVGGNAQPLPAETFTEQAVNYTLAAYIPLRRTWRRGHNILSATGRLLALRRELYEHIQVPQDTIANDGFVYLCCKTKGFEYRYAYRAVVYFRSPQTLNDHIKQNTRFLATQRWMKKYFPAEIVDYEYHVPHKLLRKRMKQLFMKHPIHCTYIFLINKYCLLRSYILKNRINVMWDVVYSTKHLKGNRL